MSAAAVGRGDLARSLGAWSAGAVLVGTTIGSGIFRVPAGVAANVGHPWLAHGVWAAGALLALAGALTLAELAVLFPRSGGIYVFLREAYGPRAAFCFGWTQLVVGRAAALGAIALILAEAATDLLSLPEGGVRATAAAAIVLVGAVNVRSVRWGAALENATAAAKVLALAGLALLVFGLAPAVGEGAPAPVSSTPVPWAGMGVALVATMWAYDGWADLTFMAGEVRDPARTLPRALIGGTLVVGLVYLLVNGAYLRALGIGGLAASPLPAADAAGALGAGAGRRIVAGLVLLSTLGALNGAMMAGPRIFFAMASDGLMARPVAAVHPRWGTPWGAVTLSTLLGTAFVSVQTFEALAGAFVLGLWPFYVLAVWGVVRLRRRRPELSRPYRVPAYPWIPLAFLAGSVVMMAASLVAQPALTLWSAAAVASGLPAYHVWMRIGRRRRLLQVGLLGTLLLTPAASAGAGTPTEPPPGEVAFVAAARWAGVLPLPRLAEVPSPRGAEAGADGPGSHAGHRPPPRRTAPAPHQPTRPRRSDGGVGGAALRHLSVAVHPERLHPPPRS